MIETGFIPIPASPGPEMIDWSTDSRIHPVGLSCTGEAHSPLPGHPRKGWCIDGGLGIATIHRTDLTP